MDDTGCPYVKMFAVSWWSSTRINVDTGYISSHEVYHHAFQVASPQLLSRWHGTWQWHITGEISKSALDPGFHVRDTSSRQSGDHFSFRSIDDVTEFSRSVTASFTASVTAPVEGINVGVSRAFDFTHNEQSTASVSFILFEWTRKGDAKEVTGAKLSDKALVKLRKHRAHFRDAYGDYYIHRLSYTTKFTAVWYDIHSVFRSLLTL